MREQENHSTGPDPLGPERRYISGLAGVFVVLALLLVGAFAFVRYLL